MSRVPRHPKGLPKDFVFVGEGRHRRTFARGRIVVKVPINDWGYGDNSREAMVFKQSRGQETPDDIRYARCRMLSNGWLMMERVDPVPYEDCPDWSDWVDGRQVGKTRSGLIVAYDYGF